MEYGFQFEGAFIGSGIYGEYLHMEEKPTVEKFISSTTKLGTVGGSGVNGLETFKPHLHYTIYTNNNYYSETTAKMLMGNNYNSFDNTVKRSLKAAKLHGAKTTYNPQNLFFINYKER